MAYPTKMEKMEQMMARAKSDRAQVRGRSAEAPGQRKKVLGLRSARSLAPGRARAAASSTAGSLRKRKAAGMGQRTYPRGTQS